MGIIIAILVLRKVQKRVIVCHLIKAQDIILAEKFDHEQLSIRPDRDQVEAYKSKRPKSGNNPTEQTQNKEKPSGSGSGLSILLLTVLSVAGGVGGWWFYQKDMDIQKELQLADSRILALEKQLSLVDAEFGASSGDIRVELQKIGRASCRERV